MFGLPRMARNTSDQQGKIERTKKPWLISRVQNGLKAVNGEPTLVRFSRNKKIPVKYYEYDRIYGRRAFKDDGVMKVYDLFDELKEITPKTEYFIFGDCNYINRHDGILVKNRTTKKEEFFSSATLANHNIAVYFNLIEYEDDSNGSVIYAEGSEHKKIEGGGEL